MLLNADRKRSSFMQGWVILKEDQPPSKSSSKNTKKKQERLPSSGTFKQIRPRRIYEDLIDLIKGQLQSGELKPGDKLPSERALADMCGVSRTAVREALRSLQTAGVIELRRGYHGGAYILESSFGLVTQSLHNTLYYGGMTLECFLETRWMIARGVLDLAGQRMVESDIPRLYEIIEKIEAKHTLQIGTEMSTAFLDELGRMAKNPVMAGMLRSFTDAFNAYVRASSPTPYMSLAPRLRTVVDQMADGDMDAALESFTDLSRDVMRHLLNSLDQPENSMDSKPL